MLNQQLHHYVLELVGDVLLEFELLQKLQKLLLGVGLDLPIVVEEHH